MKYAVLGAGLMGKAIAFDLLRQDDTEEVILADNSQNKLSETSWMLNDSRLATELFDAGDKGHVEFVMNKVDAAVAAIHYKFNVDFYSMFKDEIILLEESDLITIHPKSCSLTLSGMLLLDSIVDRLISSINESS